MQRRIHVLDDAEALARAAADWIVDRLQQEPPLPRAMSVALAGGSTPRLLYRRLAQSPYRERVAWGRVEVFWGDERCVPPTHPESNYAMAREMLLDRVPIPAERIHRVRGELEPERAAALYQRELTDVLEGVPPQPPRIDLVLLGMGADGHTASLFPGDDVLHESSRLAAVAHAPTPPQARVTLTLPVLNAARHVLFMVQGQEKAATLARVLTMESAGPDPSLPATLIRPLGGELVWMVDGAAAGGHRG